MSTELSLTIIAICLLILSVFALAALIYAIRLLIVFRRTTHHIENKVYPLLDEAKHIMHITNDTVQKIKNNVEHTTPLFQSLGKISSLVDRLSNNFSNEVHDNTMNIHFTPKKGRIDIGAWAEWAALGIALIQKLRK